MKIMRLQKDWPTILCFMSFR